MNPIILKGENLGERHCFFNHLVNEHCNEKNNFETLSEATLIDKLFKIDVANHLKHVEYIIQTLKEDDLLYVCRALKSNWLFGLEYSNIINPVYLETKLFPNMQKPTVNKVKHWIEANIKNHEQSEEFYVYYKSNFEESIKFLKNCSPPFILKEVENIVDKITPKQLKMLCEVCPSCSKMYFESMLKNNKAIVNYTSSESNFFNSLKCILKLNGNLYLELIETYESHNCLSYSATQYIMKRFKSKYLAKRELYTTQILNVNALASCLTPNECRDLVLHLAKAEYLANWFSYQSVEPFIKRLPLQERAPFKKLIFIDKAVEEKVKEWPYKKPVRPEIIDIEDHIFTDEVFHNYEYISFEDAEYAPMCYRPKMVKKRKYAKYCSAGKSCIIKRKTLLDQLFDRYRFAGFSQTYEELKNQLQAESIIGRQNIFLVLISKSGGVPEHVEVLMKLLLEKHTNEPDNVRAAVVRSLVKRLSFWRMPDELWNMMIEFGHGLGLDGHEVKPLCVEGLHAVILRNILNGISPTSDLMTSYLKNFTTFKDYSLKVSEIGLVKTNLLPLLTESPVEFLDIVSAYKIKDIADLVDSLARSAYGNEDLIKCFYEKRISRKQLIAHTFPLKQFEASYINALRHDASLLGDGEAFASLALKEKTNHSRFLRNLKVFFGEATGLADKHLMALNSVFGMTPKSTLVRPIAMLSSSDTILKKIEDLTADTKSKANMKLAGAFRDNFHLCKPNMNIVKLDWRKLGSKAVSNKILHSNICSLEHNIKSCLKWRGLYASALRLALNTPFEVDTFTFVAARRPKVAVDVATSYYFNGLRPIQPEIWQIVKEIILKFQYQKLPRRTLINFKQYSNIPKNIEADYWATVYQADTSVKRSKAIVALSILENFLHKVDKEILQKLIRDFIENDITVENLTNYKNLRRFSSELNSSADIKSNENMCMYMRYVAKYLLLTTSDDEQCEKIANTLHPLFDRIETVWKVMDDKSYIVYCLTSFLKALKYTTVFVDRQYVSCMPVFTAIIARLGAIMLRKEYFYQYTKLHFTILYYNAIQYALEQNPTCFDGDRRKVMDIVGTKLGEYVGRDITELIKEYFFSVIEIYKEGLNDFFGEYFPYKQCHSDFFATVTRGILKNDTLEAHLVAEYMYRKRNYSKTKDILEILRACKYVELKFILGDTNI